MAKYGLPYQGSKNAIADKIISALPSGNRFVDLFGGGCAITHCACVSGKYKKVLYNELNPLLVELVRNAVQGKYNYKVFKPPFITREQFERDKEKDGYIKYVWSFSNGGKAYMFGKHIEKQKESIHNWVVFNKKDEWMKKNFPDVDRYIKTDDIKKRRLLLSRYLTLKEKAKVRAQQLERLQELQIRCGSYLDYKHEKGDIVYCDPPYESAATYGESFDHEEFYNWVASRNYPVYFSSYDNISDKRFKMIWASGKRNLMNGASKMFKYECLYWNGVDEK